ncbi:MAG TPA: cytidine deaminase [bacterium]|nr:cytidine deaminase [bacterium]
MFEIIDKTSLNPMEKELLNLARKSAFHSIHHSSSHKVGAVIYCKNGKTYTGATLARTRIIGSTCAERMALDQMHYDRNREPELCVVTGLLNRPSWTEKSILTPCGVCLEMFWETIIELGLEDLDFICSSWDQSRIVRTKLSILFPKVDKGRR